MPENSMSEPGQRERRAHTATSVKKNFPRAVSRQAPSLRDSGLFGHLPITQGLRADRFQHTDHIGWKN